MGTKRKGGACNLISTSEEDEGIVGRKRPFRKTFRVYSSEFVTSSNRDEMKKAAVKITLNVNTTEGEIREILIRELPQLISKRFTFFTKDEAGKRYFCPCSLQCEGKDHSAEWNGKNIPRAAKSNRAVYVLIESTTMEETRSGGVQNDTSTNPVPSGPQFHGSVGQYSSNTQNQKEVRVVVKNYQSVSCPDLSLNGLEHQENTSVQPLSANHGNDPNQWPTEVTQLSQEQTVPETEYEKVKDGGGVTEAEDGEGERQIDMGDEEMQTDMWKNDVASTSENVFPERYFDSGFDTLSSESNALVPVDPANSLEDEELQTVFVNDSPPLDTDFNSIPLLRTPTEFEIFQDVPRAPPEIKEIVPNRGNVAGGETFYLSLADSYATHDFQVQFGPSTILVERCGDKDFKGKVPSSSKAGVVQVYLVSCWLEKISNSKSFEYIDPEKAKEDFVEKGINSSEDFETMLLLLSRKVTKINFNSNETKDSQGTNQPGGGKTQALSLLYIIVNTAAMLNAIDFFRIIFSTQVGHSVFKSCKDAQTPLEEIAKGHGHEELARLLEQKHSMYQVDENESDDEVDWRELSRAIEQYQTLKGETAEKKSIPSTSSFEQIQGYLGDGESSTSLSSLHFLNVIDTFEDQQTTLESMSEEEPDTCQITAAEGCPESTFEEQRTTPESRCEEEPDTCQTTAAEDGPENTLEEQQTTPKSRYEEKPDTSQTRGRITSSLNQDGMSDTDIINTISSSDQFRMNKAHKIKESQSSIGEKNVLANLHLNPLYLAGSDPIIMRTFQMDTFSPNEVLSLRRKLGPFDAGKTNPCAFYPDRDQAIYNLMEGLDIDFIEEPKPNLTGRLKAEKGTMHPENVTKRKGAMVTKTESITSVYWPLHSKVDSGVEIATLAGGASNVMLKEQSSEEEISQDARSFAEHFFEERSFEASKNERKSVCLSLVRKKRLAIAILTLLVIVGICLAAIFTLPADKKTPTPTTAVERMTTSRQACSNGLLTLSCEGITDVNAVHKVQWKIKFPGAGWNEFAYCYKYGMNCVVTRPVLSEGIKVLKVSNRSASLQRIAKNNTNGYAQTMCQVLYKDNSLTIHVYKTNFTAKCVRIQVGRDLDLTKILQSIVPCERVVDVEWYSINGSKFAYCNSCQGCKKISEVNREQVFWNRLQVTRGSLLLTAVQESDDGRTIRMKVDMKAPGKSSGRNVEANMESAHMYTIWIFVNTSRSPVFNDTKNEEWQMTIHEKATMPCPILQEVVNKDGTFDIVYWSLCTSKSCDDTHSTWDWIAGMNQEGTRAAVRSGINITSGGALEIQKVQLSDAGLYKCTVKRSDRSSPRISFATLFVNGVGVQADSKRIECLNEQIALECLGLESVIQNGTFLELFWKVTDPEDLKKQNIGYCNKDLNCTRYGNIGSFDRRINLSHPVRGILLVEQMVLNDRLSYTCAIERSGNKGPIVHKIIVTSSMHCLSSSAGQNLNLTQPFQAMFSMETVEDIEWYRISRDGAKVKIAYCNPSSTCILVEVCTSSCPEYLTRLKTDGLSIILSNVKQADRGLEFQCQIHHKIMTKGPRVYMIRIKAISPREDSTTEPSGTYTLRAIISEVKQDNETVGGYQPSLLPIWIPLSSCAVVVATAFIFIKCRSERRKKSRRKRRGCEAVESDDDDMTMLETTRLLLPPGADLLIKYLTTDEIRFIAHRLNGKDDHGDHLWEVIGQQLGFGAECRKWKSAEDPTETLLKAYGEQEGSTINNLIKALMEVGLTKFAEEIVRRRIKVWLNAQRGS